MDTCILLPEEFSLVLTLHPNPKNILEMNVALWSNRTLPTGALFYPDTGAVKMDRLEVYTFLDNDDVRRDYGSQDKVTEVDGRPVRHCNWVRFLKSSEKMEEVNIIGAKVKGQVVFQTVRTILPNEEIVAFMQKPEKMETNEVNNKQTILMMSPEQETEFKVKQEMDIEPISPAPSPSPSTPDLIPSPEHRDDDCKSSISDVTSSADEDKPGQYSSPLVSSSDGTDSDFHSPHTPTSPQLSTTSSSSLSPMTSSPSSMGTVRRQREKTWLPCDVCGKKFDRPSLLKRHMRTHTGEKPHACDVCGKAFSTSSSLNTHRRIHSGEKPHECQVCGKRFTASSNLYYHRMTHNKEKPHKCTLCEKSFPTPGDLRSHMYVHNGSWPFRCDVCNRGFSKQTNLKNHLLLHTGDKPHECHICKKKFALHCNLKTHLRTHEEDNQGSCVTCGRTYLKDVTSSPPSTQCIDCIRLSSPSASSSKTPSPGKKQLSDFSISKLTNSDEKKGDRTPPRGAEIYDPRLLMHSMYSPMHFVSPTLGAIHSGSPGEKIPLPMPVPFMTGFPYGHPSSPEAMALSHTLRLTPGFGQGISLEALYQSRSPVASSWPGLMAK